MDRRQFLQAGAAIGVTAILPGCQTEPEAPRRYIVPALPGIQLYTVRSLMKESVDATLEALAALGYEDVEFAGYFGYEPLEIRNMLKLNGLSAQSTHISYEALTSNLPKILDEAKSIGHEYVVCPGLPPELRTPEAIVQVADRFNDIGEACRKARLKLGYHNHSFEFRKINGEMPYRLLLERTDPALVHMELDLYWVRAAGESAEDWLSELGPRVKLVHIKDTGPDGSMVDVGDGVVDWPRLLGKAWDVGVRRYYVEHDDPEEPLETAGRSLSTLMHIPMFEG